MARTGKLTKFVYYGAGLLFILYVYDVMKGFEPTKDETVPGIAATRTTRTTSTALTSKPKEYLRSASAHHTRLHELSATRDSHAEQRKSQTAKEGVSTKQTTQNPICSRPWRTDWDAIKRSVRPAITLDPERYLYPMLVNGPNNQLIGLRDAVYLAIRLNRTLILPRFYKHKTDSTIESGSSPALPPSQRIDVASLARLVTILPYSHVRQVCGDGFDDLYFTSYKAMHSSLTHIVEDVGVSIHTKSSGEAANAYPIDPKTTFNALLHARSDKKFLNKLYHSLGRCALYVGPYRTVGVKESAPMLRNTKKKYFDENGKPVFQYINSDATPDQELYCLIVHSTPQPKHISTIVNDFMHDYALEEMPYISVHWRYDPADWLVRCRKKKKFPKRKEFLIEMCRRIEHTRPIDIARAILRFIRKLEGQSANRVQAIYFAAPLSMERFVESIETKMKSALEEDGVLEELRLLTQSDLGEHLLKYASCESLRENYEDVFSQLEMEICSRATAFLRSPSSSWSKVIKERRVINFVDKYDGNIFELAWKAAERGLNE